MDELAQELGMDPIDLRLKNAAKEGTSAAYGPRFKAIGFVECLEAAKAHPHYQAALAEGEGRGIAAGFWFNAGNDSSAEVHVAESGMIQIVEGSPDIGGSRASMAIMAAETLGIPYEQVRATVNDTTSVPYTHVTGGSRVTYASGMAVVNATNKVINELRARAAKIWDVDVEGVEWEDGHAKPSSSNVGEFEPLSLAELAAKANATGGPIGTSEALSAGGQAPGFSTCFCDVEVDQRLRIGA